MNRRFMIRDKGGGFFGVWDIERQVYRLRPEFGFVEEPEAAQAEADRLEDEAAIAGFVDFLKTGIVYRFKKEYITHFLRGLNGWMRQQKQPPLKTSISFDRLKGFYLLLEPQEAANEGGTDQTPPMQSRRGQGARSRGRK